MNLLKTHPKYKTSKGAAYCGDALKLLKELPNDCIDLVITSPPFALQRQKDYGNKAQDEYLDWLVEFAKLVFDKLKENGSFVIDIGGAYKKGIPSRSLYNFKVPIIFCEDLGYHLAEDFYWYNPSKLPSPIEWVNKRKIRAKDAVNNIWWFSKTPWPKANIKRVLTPYSDRMKKLIQDPAKFYTPKLRPSGHDISPSFGKDNGGAIPSNLLQIPNSESNSQYLRGCKTLGLKQHSARFPIKLPEFFIHFLTDPGDLVLDIFAGSNTTGQAAQENDRNWLSFELNQEYVATSAFRFLNKNSSEANYREVYSAIINGREVYVENYNPQSLLTLST